MPRRSRPRLSYANVASTLALVLALGGVSYAAVQINGKNIKNRTVGAAKIKKDALTGTEINEAKVGKVANAGDADTVGGQTAASLKLSCPTGTTFKLGECFETTLRSAGTFSQAAKACGADGRRLPTFAELEGLRQNGVATGVPNTSDYELSSSVYHDGSDQVFAIDASGNRFTGDYLTYSKSYRCVASPTNTG